MNPVLPCTSNGVVVQPYIVHGALVNPLECTHSDSAMDESGQHYGIELGRWVRGRRQSLRMTQEEVAERIGPETDPNYITQLENGRKKNLPDTTFLIGIAEALRTSVTDVLRGAGVLPIDVDAMPDQAPGSATMHALIDMIDWTRDTTSRENVEGLLRLILDRQRASAGSAVTPAPDRA